MCDGIADAIFFIKRQTLSERIVMFMTMILPKSKLVKCLCCLLLLTIVLLMCFISPYLKTFSISWVYPNVKRSDGKCYLCPLFMGRLGNTMFQYAAAYGIASEKDMRVLLPNDSLIARSFKVDGDVLENATRVCSTFPVYHAPDSEWSMYNPSFSVGIPRNNGSCIRGYFQSYKYFNRVKDAIKKQFLSFYEDTRTKAIQILQETKKYYLATLNVTNVTLIGVHVRRGDRLGTAEVQLGCKVAPKEYFIKAMDYFSSKYTNSVFVVCGENQTWERETVPSIYNALFLNQSSTPDVDLAILTMCDHMIMSIGSYSWWAAYLNVGEIVYYKDWILPGSYLHKGYTHEDYFPPEWIPK